MRLYKILCLILVIFLLAGCHASHQPADVAATTAPVAQFARTIAEGTPLTITQVISDNVSCLHDYSLSVRQMEALETSDLVLISGAGLEETMEDALSQVQTVVDCSTGVPLLETDGHHHEDDGHEHDHEHDPHIWLSPVNAAVMAENICAALTSAYPEHTDTFRTNTDLLVQRLDDLQQYGEQALQTLSCRQLITFHDGFGYLAHAFDLEILEAIEEESGSEASAAELIHIVELVETHQIPAIFTEVNGSVSAASVISAETGVSACTLDMAMGSSDYLEAMKHNIDTLKGALQ